MTNAARQVPPSNPDYDALFWLTSSPTLEVDGNGVVMRANVAACRIVDADPRAIEGQILSTLLGAPVTDAVREGGPEEIEAQLSSGPVPLLLRSAPRTLAGTGGPSYIVQLTRRVGRDEKDAERRGDASRWSLLDDVSHNLGTPLAIVAGYAETLAERWDDLPPADVAKATTAIRRHAHRAVEELQALQARVRISGGGSGTVPTTVLLAWLRRMLHGPLSANGTMLVGTSETEIVTIDIGNARQALLNICHLALNAEPTPLAIELRIRQVEAGTEFEVTSDGGITPPDDVTVRTTALIVKDCGGRYTPATPEEPAHRMWLPTAAPNTATSRRAQIPVALIEDDPDTASLIRASLANSSTLFDLVADERTFVAGLDAVRRTRPRILLLDQGLPDRLGTEGLEDLKDAVPGMTVVVLSASQPDGLRPADDLIWLEKGRVLADLGSELIDVLSAR